MYLNVLLSLFIALTTSTLVAFAEDTKVVNIGFIAGLSGQYGHISHLMLAGAEDAIRRCNSSGQLTQKNTRLKLIVEDDGLADAKLTLNAVRKFVSINRVAAILGWVYSTAKPIKSALGNKRTPVIFFWDYNSGMKELGEHYYGTGPNTTENASLLVTDALSHGHSPLGVISIIDEWADRTRTEIVKELQLKKQTLILDQTISSDSSDFKSVIVRAKKSEAKGLVLLVWGSSLINLVNQLHTMWPEVKLYMFGQPESDMLLIGNAAEGIRITNGWIEGTLASSLIEAIAKDPLIENKNISPVDLTYAAYGFQGGDILCTAIKQLLVENKSINDETLNATLRTIDYDLGLGRIGPGRYNHLREHMLQWKNGSFTKND